MTKWPLANQRCLNTKVKVKVKEVKTSVRNAGLYKRKNPVDEMLDRGISQDEECGDTTALKDADVLFEVEKNVHLAVNKSN